MMTAETAELKTKNESKLLHKINLTASLLCERSLREEAMKILRMGVILDNEMERPGNHSPITICRGKVNEYQDTIRDVMCVAVKCGEYDVVKKLIKLDNLVDDSFTGGYRYV